MYDNGKLTLEQRDIGVRISIAVKHLRQLQGITQKMLSRKTGVLQSRISMLENGKRNAVLVNLNDLERIAMALGKRRLSDLIKFAEEVPGTDEIIKHTTEAIKKIRHKTSQSASG